MKSESCLERTMPRAVLRLGISVNSSKLDQRLQLLCLINSRLISLRLVVLILVVLILVAETGC